MRAPCLKWSFILDRCETTTLLLLPGLNKQLSQELDYLFSLITGPLIYDAGKAVNEDITLASQPRNVFKISNKNPHMKSCENNPLENGVQHLASLGVYPTEEMND